MADLTFKDSDSPDTATLNFDDAKGFATTPDNPPSWSADDGGTVITIAPSEDGVSCVATPVAPGTSHVTVATLDENGDTVTGTSTVIVTPGEAEALDVVWAPIAPVVPAPVAQTPPVVPSAPEVLQAAPSQNPGVTTLQGATVKLDSDDDEEPAPGVAPVAPKILEHDEDTDTFHAAPATATGTATATVSTPAVSAAPSAGPENTDVDAGPLESPALPAETPASPADATVVPASEPAPADTAQPDTGDTTGGGSGTTGVPAS